MRPKRAARRRFIVRPFTLERNPDTVRAPDVAFVRASRWPSEPVIGHAEMAPDLAVEVLSPSESRVRSDSVSVLSRNDVIDGEAVLPGFRLPVSEAFG